MYFNGDKRTVPLSFFKERLILYHRMQKEGGTLLNQRHSIAPKNWEKFGIINIKR